MRIFLLLSLVTIFSIGCHPRLKVIQNDVFVSSVGVSLPYRTFFPKVEKGVKLPLILFLHGSGERGTDNEKQLIHVVPYLTSDSFQRLYPSIVLAPQCPEEDYWGPIKRFDWTFYEHGIVTPAMESVIELLDKISKTPDVDSTRIYVCGLSMGAIGVYDILHRKPNLFAVAVPICGVSNLGKVNVYKQLPMWVLHGDEDTVIPVEKSREFVAKRLSLQTPVIYTEYNGEGHGIWEKAIREKGLWEWVFSQKK
ncbi:MAG: phospholipase [Saprospiraceae bacterium]